MSKKKQETGRKAGLLQIGAMALGGAFVGGFGSFLFFCYKNQSLDFLKSVSRLMGRYDGPTLIALSVIMSVLALGLSMRGRYRLKHMDLEDEEAAEKLERDLHRYQSLLSFLSILSICISGIVISKGKEVEVFRGLVPIIIFCCAAFFTMFCIDKLVRCEKKLNPEKKGNVLSWNFNRQWLESCDEREKLRYYKAGYYTHTYLQLVYLVIFTILLLFSTVAEVGAQTFLVLGVIWCAQILIYWYEYEHRA